GAMTLRSRGGGEPVAATGSVEPRTAAATPGVGTAATGAPGKTEALALAAARADSIRADSARSAKLTPAPTAPVVLAGRPAASAASAEPTAPVVKLRLKKVNIPTLALTNVDSLVRSSSKRGRDPYTDQ